MLKLTLSETDKKLELASKILLVVLWGLTVYTIFMLPEKIPTHYNVLGKVDNYDNKITIWILPILATIIYFSLTHLSKYPDILNYINKINGDNASRQYIIATRMLRIMKLTILVLFLLITLFTYLTAIRVINGLGVWFLPFTSGLVLIPIIISIFQSSKKAP